MRHPPQQLPFSPILRRQAQIRRLRTRSTSSSQLLPLAIHPPSQHTILLDELFLLSQRLHRMRFAGNEGRQQLEEEQRSGCPRQKDHRSPPIGIQLVQHCSSQSLQQSDEGSPEAQPPLLRINHGRWSPRERIRGCDLLHRSMQPVSPLFIFVSKRALVAYLLYLFSSIFRPQGGRNRIPLGRSKAERRLDSRSTRSNHRRPQSDASRWRIGILEGSFDGLCRGCTSWEESEVGKEGRRGVEVAAEGASGEQRKGEGGRGRGTGRGGRRKKHY